MILNKFYKKNFYQGYSVAVGLGTPQGQKFFSKRRILVTKGYLLAIWLTCQAILIPVGKVIKKFTNK